MAGYSAGAGSPKSVLVVTPDRVGDRRSGIAIRHSGIAGALSRAGFRVRFASTDPRSADEDSGLEVAKADKKTIGRLCEGVDAVIVQGTVLRDLPFLAGSGLPTVVDLVCPVFLENLERYRGRRDIHLRLEADLRVFREAAAAGDFFLAGSERQRRFWLGFLAAMGRVNGLTAACDPNLERLVGVVPFGIPAEPPSSSRSAIRGVLPGIGKDETVLLWSGGLWPWMDPLTPIRAVARASAKLPGLRLVFTGLRHPQEDRDSAKTAAAREEAERLGVLDRSVFFVPGWVPSGEMPGYYLDSDAGISAHGRTIESEFAVRTKVFDYLWSGLPMIVTDGDFAADLVRSEGLGFTAAPGDAEQWADAILKISDPRVRAGCAESLRRVAAAYSWDLVIEPLASFLRRPEKSGDRELFKIYDFPSGAHSLEALAMRVLAAFLHEGPAASSAKGAARLLRLFRGRGKA